MFLSGKKIGNYNNINDARLCLHMHVFNKLFEMMNAKNHPLFYFSVIEFVNTSLAIHATLPSPIKLSQMIKRI